MQDSLVRARGLDPQVQGRTTTKTVYPLLIGKEMKMLVWFIKWFLIDISILVAVFALSWWYFSSTVAEEYRTGVRTETSGDSIMIPVMGGVMVTAVALLCVNVFQLIFVRIRRRRMLPDRTRKGPLSPEEAKEQSPQNNGAEQAGFRACRVVS